MPIKCYRKPNRSKPRVFSPCDAARIAGYAIRDGSDRQDVLNLVARKLGYAAIATPTNQADTSVEIAVDRWIDWISGVVQDLQLIVGDMQEWAEALTGLMDALLSHLPDWLSDSDSEEESILMKILRGSIRALARLVLIAIELLKKIRGFFNSYAQKFTNYAEMLRQLAVFLLFAKDLRKLEPQKLSDYDGFCD